MRASGEYTVEQEPLVSVIIPTYDRPMYLQSSVETVLAQTYDNIEIIIVDDHSPTPAESVLKNVPELNGVTNVVCVRHEENRGVCAARNTGLEAANGELVALLDDDDYWEVEKLERQVATFRNSTPKTGVIYTNTRITDDEGNTTNVTENNHTGNVTKRLFRGNFATISTLLVHASAISNAGKFDVTLPNWEDWEWCIRLSQHAHFDVVPRPFVVIQKGDHEKRSDDFEKKRDEGYDQFLAKNRPVAATHGKWFERKAIGWITFHLGYAALSKGYYTDARRILFKAIYWWPFDWRFYLYWFIAFTGQPGYRLGQRTKRRVESLQDQF